GAGAATTAERAGARAPAPPLRPGQKREPADNIESADGGAFIDEDRAVGFGDAYVVTEEETRQYLCDTEENHQRGHDCDSLEADGADAGLQNERVTSEYPYQNGKANDAWKEPVCQRRRQTPKVQWRN